MYLPYTHCVCVSVLRIHMDQHEIHPVYFGKVCPSPYIRYCRNVLSLLSFMFWTYVNNTLKSLQMFQNNPTL
jgi:hypothetical protein